MKKYTKMSTEQFVAKCKIIWGDKYNYSKTKYVDSATKIKIGCEKHGFVEMAIRNHHKKGCTECFSDNLKIEKQKDRETKGTVKYIKRVKKIHGDKYDYSKTKYIGAGKKLIVTCKVHGDFEQDASAHLRGFGCYQCSRDERKDNKEIFIEKAKKLHGKKYDYSKVIYKHSQLKVIIGCKKHGDFEQVPNNHLMGQRCPECGRKTRIENRTNFYKPKTYNLLGTEYRVMRYEPKALDHLINKLKVNPKYIKLGNEIPVIRYKTKIDLAENPYFKDRLYFPDIYIPKTKTLIEVKSSYTFRLSFDNVLEKRKAVIKKGYQFKLMLFRQNDKLIELPEFWYKCKLIDLIKYLKV